MKRIIPSLLAIIFPLFLQAQKTENTARITCKVTDAQTKKALSLVTISMISLNQDSLVSATGITNAEGTIVLNAGPGNYILKAGYIGYSIYKSAPFSITDINQIPIALQISLQPNSITLNQVSIQSEKKTIELIPGGYKFNVDKAIGAATSNMFEVLKQVPGIIVDGSNNIQLQGKRPTVMVNGRKVSMSGNDLASYLKSINVSQVSDIDVNTNPNVTFDADGEGGVLNIKLKQNNAIGIYGSVSSNVSSLVGTEDSFNLNFRKNKWDLSTSYNFSYREDTYKRHNYYENKSLNDSLFIFRQDMVSNKKETANSFKFGAAYTIDSTSTISANFFGAIFKGNSPWNTLSRIFNKQDIYQKKYIQDEGNKIDNRFQIYDLLYKKIFRDKSQLSLGFNYSVYDNKSNQEYQRKFFNSSDLPITDNFSEIRRIRTVRPYKLTTGNADYFFNLKTNLRLDMGLKYTSTNNGSYFINSLFSPELNAFVEEEQLNNNLDYSEHVFASYGMLSGKLQQFSYQVGLRYEDFGYQLSSASLPQKYSNSYNNLFPSLNVTYKTKDQKSTYALNIGRRIQRPNYAMLNPFLNVTSLAQYTSGNPYLKPYFVNKAELQYSRSYGAGQFLMFSGFFSNSKDVFSNNFRFSEELKMNITSYDNLRSTNQFGITAYLQNKFNTWFNANLYLSGNKSDFQSSAPGDILLPGLFSFTGNLNLNFIIKQKTQLQLYGYYVSKNNQFQTQNGANKNISVAAQRKFYNNRLSASLSLEDIFNINNFPVTVNTPDVYVSAMNKLKSRFIRFGLSYSFGKSFSNKSEKDLRKDTRIN